MPLDQVANGTQRKQIEEAGRQALDILASRGIVLTTADLQAVLWYAEKRLWNSYAVRKGKGEDNDYVDGAIALLRERGIEDDRISQALASSDRYRVDPRFDSRGADGRVRGPAPEGGAAEGTRLSRRPTAPEDGDTAGGRTNPRAGFPPAREVRAPESRRAAEARVSDLEPVTSEDLRNLTPEFFSRPGWAIITATREDLPPQQKARLDRINDEELRYLLDAEGIPYIEVRGMYEGVDQGSSHR